MASEVNETNGRYLGTKVSSGGAVAYSPLREMLGYEPFRGFAPVDPQMDVVRTEAGFDLDIPVAGFSPEQIDVVIKDDVLTITGKNERRSFTRSLHVPDDIDPAKIEATVEHGMLSLKLQRHAEAEPRRIEVRPRG